MSAANVGRIAVWNSRGYADVDGRYHRQGVIVAFVPKRNGSMRAAQRMAGAPERTEGGLDAMDYSSVDRYLVRADRVGAKGQALKSKWYAPHASMIDEALRSRAPTPVDVGAP